jgi:hypothetical protein
VVRLNRAVAVGEADGPQAGDLELYAEASRAATSAPERDHLTREAARVGQLGVAVVSADFRADMA